MTFNSDVSKFNYICICNSNKFLSRQCFVVHLKQEKISRYQREKKFQIKYNTTAALSFKNRNVAQYSACVYTQLFFFLLYFLSSI